MTKSTISLPTEPYLEARARWPQEGRHIMASYDDDTIVVYQAYNDAIGGYAVAHGRFGGDFSYARMSWIKPNFLWMMYRAGWGRKANQTTILGVRIPRTFFDALLAAAVPSSWDRRRFETREAWQRAVRRSEVRLQWDPDHGPGGGKEARRAIQLGLRGEALRSYGEQEALEIIDVTPFVVSQRDRVASPYEGLVTPVERPYVPADAELVAQLGLDGFDANLNASGAR